MSFSLTLTKRQVAKVIELMCPNCGQELKQLSKTQYECPCCMIQYHAERVPESNA